MTESMNRKEEINRDQKQGRVLLDATVFPSEDKTISVREDARSCDRYEISEMIGFDKKTNRPVYGESKQVINFVNSRPDGTMNYGLQSEQLVHMLVHRTKRLNEILPSKHSDKMVKGLEMFLEACQERFDERMKEGVAGTNNQLPDKDKK